MAPLIYATARALRDAERLLPGRVLENAIEREIEDGNVVASREAGVVFDSKKEWIAHVRRVPARLARRRAWLVICVKAHRERKVATMATPAGFSNDKGVFDAPKTGISEIDKQVQKMQAGDTTTRKAAAAKATRTLTGTAAQSER